MNMAARNHAIAQLCGRQSKAAVLLTTRITAFVVRRHENHVSTRRAASFNKPR
jgi:hypothetical protein